MSDEKRSESQEYDAEPHEDSQEIENEVAGEETQEPQEETTNWEEIAQSRYDQMIRLQADFDNFRRRMDRERQEIAGQVAERLLKDLLPVFDNLERAVQFMPEEGEAKAWRVGVEMTLKGFLEALARMGVQPIEAVGAAFDPRYHEAVQRVDSDQPEGVVVEQLQKGFLWQDRVLRASLVKVSSGVAPSEE